jgi:hypothetical protein
MRVLVLLKVIRSACESTLRIGFASEAGDFRIKQDLGDNR